MVTGFSGSLNISNCEDEILKDNHNLKSDDRISRTLIQMDSFVLKGSVPFVILEKGSIESILCKRCFWVAGVSVDVKNENFGHFP